MKKESELMGQPQKKPAHELILKKLNDIRHQIGVLQDLGFGRPGDPENVYCHVFTPLRISFMYLLDIVEEMDIPDEKLETFVRELGRCAPEGDGHLCYRVGRVAANLAKKK